MIENGLDPMSLDIPNFTGDLVEQLRAYAREAKKRKLGDLSDTEEVDGVEDAESLKSKYNNEIRIITEHIIYTFVLGKRKTRSMRN
jgi:hypothetical protein